MCGANLEWTGKPIKYERAGKVDFPYSAEGSKLYTYLSITYLRKLAKPHKVLLEVIYTCTPNQMGLDRVLI